MNVSLKTPLTKYKDFLILLLINLILSIAFTRFHTIYGTDSPYFPYNNPIVEEKYYLATFIGYNPWLNLISGFSISSFVEYFLAYFSSNIPFSDTFFIFFLSSIGSIFVFLFIKDLLTSIISSSSSSSSSLLVTLSAYYSSIFYLLSPNLGNDLYHDQIATIYINAFLPPLVYLIRKYFLAENFISSLIYFISIIPIFTILYYTIIPVYVLSFVILTGSLTVLFSIKAIRKRRQQPHYSNYLRVLILLVIVSAFIYIEFPNIISLYNLYTVKSFVIGSYYYWIDNSHAQPIYYTLLGLSEVQAPEDSLLYIFSLFVFIISLFYIFNKDLLRNIEVNTIFLLTLVFALLYSIPNFPFSGFWQSLFLKFPILVDVRTPYIEVAPYQTLLQAYLLGLGVYSFLFISNKINSKAIKTYLSALPLVGIIVISIGNPIGILHGGSYVVIPNSFFQVINYLNKQGQNMSVLPLPISETEDGEEWYQGPSLFPLFLKPQTILGGGYYSISGDVRQVLCKAYVNIYYGNITNNNTKFIENVFYLFDIHYIILEKDYQSYYYPTYPVYWNFSQLQKGVNTYEKAGIVKLVLENRDYEIYTVNGVSNSSSLAFISNNSYSINYLISSNISSLLRPLQVKVISPTEYEIKISPQEINKVSYLYFMIPYTSWKIVGAEVLNSSSIQGYSLFKIKPLNQTIKIIYSNYPLPSFDYLKLFSIFILPYLLSIILYVIRRNIINSNNRIITTITTVLLRKKK
ncbi:hypothetical protein DFR86_00870 [Acidianus sulfidivorans JP7]|uniref:Uncharacterized protein n=1 Tax=Acidianus sulfidivorans JP7 TaxID=619593 RepID=A0A2U9IJL9_9CREN|nr:hypothetical protein [Acidianus sulfidivorans]AWR96237.1 hypothetical protein DFR86_00870 [Acidianus sulfidivorans JP7]